MQLFRGSLLIGALFMLVAFAVPTAFAAGSAGTIKGRVVNKTSGGQPITAGEVRLRKFVDNVPRDDVKGRTDAAGNFSFTDLSTGEKDVYYVLFQYAGVDYFTDPISFKEGANEKTEDLEVYEVTDSREAVRTTLHHIVIDFADSHTLNIKEMILFENTGDRTYVGSKEFEPGKKETLVFTLPAGAADFKEEQGLFSTFYQNTGEKVIDSMPVFPGQRQVVYGYTVHAQSGSYTFKRRIDYSVPDFSLLVASKGAKLSAPGLTSRGKSQGEKGQDFLHYTGKDLKVGSDITAELKGLGSPTGAFYWVLVALLGLPVAAGIGVPLVRRTLRRRKGPEIEQDPAEAQLRGVEQERKSLIAAIAALDDKYEAGKVPANEYNKVRSEQKKKLVELTKKLNSVGSQ